MFRGIQYIRDIRLHFVNFLNIFFFVFFLCIFARKIQWMSIETSHFVHHIISNKAKIIFINILRYVSSF